MMSAALYFFFLRAAGQHVQQEGGTNGWTYTPFWSFMKQASLGHMNVLASSLFSCQPNMNRIMSR